MHKTKRILMIAAAGILIAGQALAHAHLKTAVPAPDSVLKASPSELDLTFSEGVNLKFSGVKIVGPDKVAVKLGEPMLMDSDTTLMTTIDDTPAAGHYTVEWHTLSSDGHKTKGKYGFTIKP